MEPIWGQILPWQLDSKEDRWYWWKKLLTCPALIQDGKRHRFEEAIQGRLWLSSLFGIRKNFDLISWKLYSRPTWIVFPVTYQVGFPLSQSIDSQWKYRQTDYLQWCSHPPEDLLKPSHWSPFQVFSNGDGPHLLGPCHLVIVICLDCVGCSHFYADKKYTVYRCPNKFWNNESLLVLDRKIWPLHMFPALLKQYYSGPKMIELETFVCVLFCLLYDKLPGTARHCKAMQGCVSDHCL